jgi:hypothetical protein
MFKFDREVLWDNFKQKFGAPASSTQSGLIAILDQVEQDNANWANVYSLAYGLATFKWELAIRFNR